MKLTIGAGNETRTRDLDLGKVALYQLSYARIVVNLTAYYLTAALEKFGAGNETRTRDLDLGKVALYQLSYARNIFFNDRLVTVELAFNFVTKRGAFYKISSSLQALYSGNLKKCVR